MTSNLHRISQCIHSHGPISFSQFMQNALSDPDYGY